MELRSRQYPPASRARRPCQDDQTRSRPTQLGAKKPVVLCTGRVLDPCCETECVRWADRDQGRHAEEMVRDALATGATVDMPSDHAVERLDQAGEVSLHDCVS